MTVQLRSPLCWLGGKSRIACRIVEAFPAPSSYRVFVEPFVGSASILFAKPRYNHLEVINDLNEDLMNFWMVVREEVEYLEWKLKTLPYSEALFHRYRKSLESEEAVNLGFALQQLRWEFCSSVFWDLALRIQRN